MFQEKDENGEGKRVFLSLRNLATFKQAPYLIRGLVKLMPKLTLVIEEGPDNLILKRDLERNGIITNLNYKLKSSDLTCELDYDNGGIRSFSKDVLTFSIDPLKFEKRRLLSQEEISNLKEEYKIREKEKVVLGGSFHESDIRFLKKSVYEILNKDENVKFILVPRYIDSINENFYFMGEGKENARNKKVMIVNKEGVLDNLYSICDIALLGNTFGQGKFYDGQNPLEPAFYGKRIISGCNYAGWNLEAFLGLKKSGLLKVIFDEENMGREILSKPDKKILQASCEKAQEFIKSQQGMENAYARIVQKVLYNELTEKEEEFLSSSQSYDSIKEHFK
ncbi:MAG: hypothetical protein NUV46_02735 [Nanoarchaeota archaeon]|nr:hypothetical protein [Nanoarchaeota archaeon]